MIQGLKLHAPNAGGLGLIPGQGTRAQMPQLRVYTLQLRPGAAKQIKLKILKDMGIPDHLTYLLRNLYAGQGASVSTGHGTTDWFQIGKGVCEGCILSPCLFNFYEEYIMRNRRDGPLRPPGTSGSESHKSGNTLTSASCL